MFLTSIMCQGQRNAEGNSDTIPICLTVHSSSDPVSIFSVGLFSSTFYTPFYLFILFFFIASFYYRLFFSLDAATSFLFLIVFCFAFPFTPIAGDDLLSSFISSSSLPSLKDSSAFFCFAAFSA